MRSYLGKPFPASFYDRSYKRKHYLVWWCICNELDEDPDGWIRINRMALERVFVKTQKMPHSQITSILQTLAKDGYLTLRAIKGPREFSTEEYEIQISSQSWEPVVVVKKQYVRTTPRNYYQERKARLLAALQEQSSES